jgi:hypothetical protein
MDSCFVIRFLCGFFIPFILHLVFPEIFFFAFTETFVDYPAKKTIFFSGIKNPYKNPRNMKTQIYSR